MKATTVAFCAGMLAGGPLYCTLVALAWRHVQKRTIRRTVVIYEPVPERDEGALLLEAIADEYERCAVWAEMDAHHTSHGR